MILSLLNSDPHRCAFLDHLLLATKWLGVVGWVWLWPYHFKGACSGPVDCVQSLMSTKIGRTMLEGGGAMLL